MKKWSGRCIAIITHRFPTALRRGAWLSIQTIISIFRLAAKTPMTSCIIWIRPSAKYTVFAMMAACPATIPFLWNPKSAITPRPGIRSGASATALVRGWLGIPKPEPFGTAKWVRVAVMRSISFRAAAIMAGRFTPMASIIMVNGLP